jgi:aldehyde:ferredoxin oxidoreductase
MEQYKVNRKACYACPIACWGHAMVEKGDFSLKEPAHMPEYEAIGCLGGYCLNSDFEVIIKVNDICNRAGIDVISTGTAISFAMDCFDRGILSKSELDGIDMKWGDGKAMVALAEKIVNNEGIGELLAKGVKVASEEIGKGAEELAMHIQGQELPAHDGKLFTSMGLSYGVDSTPARHTQWSFASKPQKFEDVFPDIETDFDQEEYKGRAQAHRKYAALAHVINSLGSCIFGYNCTDVFTHPECYAAVTGWDTDVDEFAKTGERIGNLRQIFTVREGYNPIDFNYPKPAQGSPPLKEGPLKKVTLDIDTMKNEFYEEMDWDKKTGMPSKKKLKELGLDKVVK